MNEHAAITAEDIGAKINIAAYHEAGHATIAGVLRIQLRPEGIMVAQDAQGLACYSKVPDKADPSVEANILSSFAGFYAENIFAKCGDTRFATTNS